MNRFRTLAALLGLVLGLVLALAPAASAQSNDPDYPITTNPTVQNTIITTGETSPTVQNARVETGSTLPVTGGDVLGLTIIGLVAVGAGIGLVRYQRSAAEQV